MTPSGNPRHHPQRRLGGDQRKVTEWVSASLGPQRLTLPNSVKILRLFYIPDTFYASSLPTWYIFCATMSNIFSNSPTPDNREGVLQASVPLDPQGSNPPTGAERKKRTRTGCVNCSRRRRKCDEAKPTCTGCKRRGEKCQWRMMGAFRDSNIKVLESDHPSMSQGVAASKRKRQSKFKIVNTASPRTERAPTQQDQVLPEKGSVHGSPPPSAPDHSATPVPVAVAEDNSDPTNPGVNQGLSPPYSSDTSSHPRKTFDGSPGQVELQTHVSPLGLQEPSPHSHYEPNLQFDFQPPQTRDDSTSHPYINSSPEYAINDLAALRGLGQNSQFHSSVTGSYQTVQSPVFDHGVFSDPTNLINDVFLPGSAYEALHTTLRNRQLWTARPDFPSRRSSQDSVPMVHTPTGYSDAGSVTRTERRSRRSGSSRRFELPPEREHVLWENYLNEICSWVSKFAANRVGFQTDVKSLTCSIINDILLRPSLRWPRLQPTFATLSWPCLHDSLKDNKMRNRNPKVCRYIKKLFISSYPSWEARQPLSLRPVSFCVSWKC